MCKRYLIFFRMGALLLPLSFTSPTRCSGPVSQLLCSSLSLSLAWLGTLGRHNLTLRYGIPKIDWKWTGEFQSPLGSDTVSLSVPVMVASLVFTGCEIHSARPDWRCDRPVGSCGPAERPGDLFYSHTSQPDVQCALWCQRSKSRFELLHLHVAIYLTFMNKEPLSEPFLF